MVLKRTRPAKNMLPAQLSLPMYRLKKLERITKSMVHKRVSMSPQGNIVQRKCIPRKTASYVEKHGGMHMTHKTSVYKYYKNS